MYGLFQGQGSALHSTKQAAKNHTSCHYHGSLYCCNYKLVFRNPSRMNFLMKEAHVASKVQKMEPLLWEIRSAEYGTSILIVVLCQVKKENLGIPVPYLSWKVYLGTKSIFTLKVYEHGRNGVAFKPMMKSEESNDGLAHFISFPPSMLI